MIRVPNSKAKSDPGGLWGVDWKTHRINLLGIINRDFVAKFGPGGSLKKITPISAGTAVEDSPKGQVQFGGETLLIRWRAQSGVEGNGGLHLSGDGPAGDDQHNQT